MALAGSNRSSGMDAYLNFRTYQHGQRTKNLRRMQATCSLNSAIMILIEYIYIYMLNYIELYWYIIIPHSGDVWLLQPHCPEALLWLGDSWSAWLVLALAVDMSWVVREKNAGSVGSSRFPHRSAGHGPVRGTARPWYGNDWPFGQSYQWWLRAKCVGETGKKTSTDRTLSSEFNRVVQVFRHFQMFFQGHTAHIIMTISSKKKRIT